MSFLRKTAGKEELIKSYEAFWQWFNKNQKPFFKVVKEHGDLEKIFFRKLSDKLSKIKDGFFCLTGMLNDDTAELVFTADGNINNIAFVEELVSHAPQIAGWVFTALKAASDIKDTNITMAGLKFSNENISFYPNILSDFPDEIDIVIVHKDHTEENKTTIENGTLIFLENFIGELDFATTVDAYEVVGPRESKSELIPIEKLKDYLIWRQKEFVEKYEGTRYDTENDTYSSFTAELENGNSVVAIFDTELLEWDKKPSHPWIAKIQIPYDGENRNGMPDKKTYELLDKIEAEISVELKDFDGYLNIGRETADSVREIYFACKEFRNPSKQLDFLAKKYANKVKIDYYIYKDKYWQSFNRFIYKG